MATKQIVCDTDVLIDYWNTKSKRHQETKQHLEHSIGLDNVIISVITQMELIAGARNKAEESKINKKLSRFNIALINNTITKISLELYKSYRLSHGIGIPDCFIAATAKVLEVELFTYNTKDFIFINEIRLYRA
jgi:predicted nucleic acid-binding protein